MSLRRQVEKYLKVTPILACNNEVIAEFLTNDCNLMSLAF